MTPATKLTEADREALREARAKSPAALQAQIATLTAENERLREALAFYADKNNWRSSRFYIGGQPGNSKAQNDRGAKALAAAEAKPGTVWKEWDGSEQGPVKLDDYIWSKGADGGVSINGAGDLDWMYVTHYAEITPPEEVSNGK